MFITPSFKKSLIVEQFQGNYLKLCIDPFASFVCLSKQRNIDSRLDCNNSYFVSIKIVRGHITEQVLTYARL